MSRGSATADGDGGNGDIPGGTDRAGDGAGDRAGDRRDGPSWDIILSYAAAAEPDAAWACWLAWQLAQVGYRVLPLSVAAPGAGGGDAGSVDLERHLTAGGEVLVIWSSAYLATQADPAGVPSPDGTVRPGRVMVVRVEDCPRPGAFGRLLAFDLFGLDEVTARDWLLRQITVVAPRPTSALIPPPFPADASAAVETLRAGAAGAEAAGVEAARTGATGAGATSVEATSVDATGRETPGRETTDGQTRAAAAASAAEPVPTGGPGPPGAAPGLPGSPAVSPDRSGVPVVGSGPPPDPTSTPTSTPTSGATGADRTAPTSSASPTSPASRDLTRAQRVSVLREERGHPMSVAFSPTAPLLVTGGTDTVVQVWQLDYPAPPRSVATVGYGRRINQEWVRALTFSPDGNVLAAAGDAGTTVLWDVTRPDRPVPMMTLTGHRGYLHDLGFSPGGTLLATAGDDRAVLLWDLAEPGVPRRAAILSGHRSPVRAVTFSPDGTLLVTGSEDKTVILWDLAEPTRPVATATVTGARGPVHTLAFSPDGDLLAVAGKDRVLRLYSVDDPAAPTVLAEMTDHRRAVHAVAFSPDGRLLAAGSGDRTATVRDITDPQHPGAAFRLPAHGAPVHDVAFAADSRLLATASGDRTTVLWDLLPEA